MSRQIATYTTRDWTTYNFGLLQWLSIHPSLTPLGDELIICHSESELGRRLCNQRNVFYFDKEFETIGWKANRGNIDFAKLAEKWGRHEQGDIVMIQEIYPSTRESRPGNINKRLDKAICRIAIEE